MKIKKVLSVLLASVMSLGIMGCSMGDAGTKGVKEQSKGDKFIGVLMPTQSSQRWIQDGGNMKEQLEAKGYKVDLQYAEDVVETQVSQLENMITKGVDVLVIASIDGEALVPAIAKAADEKISIIAYDRLIRGSEFITYYATFDNFKVGVQQGKYIEEKLGLKEGKGPFNIELFGGSPDDNNSYFFYDGAMSILQPYIDNGKLVVKSGQLGMEKVSTLRWDGATAQARMDNILTAHYADGSRVDAVLSPYDGISIGILSSLKAVGYGKGDLTIPIVTGQDAEIPSVKSIIAGEQAQTVFKDTRTLAQKTVEMVDAVLQGKEATVNDTKTYDNGVKVVPSFLCEPVSVDINNYKEALIDTGYYTEADLK